MPPVAEVLREFPSRRLVTEHGEMPQGLAVRLALLREHATGEIDLGDSARFYPSEAALGALERGRGARPRRRRLRVKRRQPRR